MLTTLMMIKGDDDHHDDDDDTGENIILDSRNQALILRDVYPPFPCACPCGQGVGGLIGECFWVLGNPHFWRGTPSDLINTQGSINMGSTSYKGKPKGGQPFQAPPPPPNFGGDPVSLMSKVSKGPRKISRRERLPA